MHMPQCMKMKPQYDFVSLINEMSIINEIFYEHKILK